MWVARAWGKVPPDLILSGFRKTGIKSTGQEENDHTDDDSEYDPARANEE